MDRGAWRATVHGVAEPDVTEVTQHARTDLVFSAHTLTVDQHSLAKANMLTPWTTAQQAEMRGRPIFRAS